MRLKRLGWVGAMALGSVLALRPVAQAQEKKDDKPAAPPVPATPAVPAVPTVRPDMRAQRVDAQLKALDRRVTLTEDQKTKIKPIYEEEMKKFEEMAQDKALPTEERIKKLRELREASQAKIKPLLTAEQQAKMARPQVPGAPPRVEPPAATPPK